MTDGNGILGLGTSVSISGDGTVAVVGEPEANSGAGAALVYDLVDGSWTFKQRLTAPSETGAGHFGASVSMDNGGQNLLVGAPDDNGGVGSAWAFALSGSTWSSQGELDALGSESGDGRFGASVALAGGGEVALIGAPDNANGTGQAYTYHYYSGSNTAYWYLYQSMDSVPAAGAHFGTSVSLSNNANAADVGAPNDGPGGNGVVYPYAYFGLNSNYWIDHNPIDAPVGASDFGASVTAGNSGYDVVIGAPGTGSNQGAVYDDAPGNGQQVAVFTDPHATAGDEFGASVAEGGQFAPDNLVIGAPGDGGGAGAAYDFGSPDYGSTWTPNGALTPAAGTSVAGDAYGSSVAVSVDDSAAIVGAPGANSSAGAVTPMTTSPSSSRALRRR